MSMVAKLIREDLIQLGVRADNQTDLLCQLSDSLLEKGYVKPSFKESIIQREMDYPTGLQLERKAVAIPHTYAEHVNQAFLYINKLAQPISFIQMGTDDELVDAALVIVLGIDEPKEQTGLLMELMEMFNDSAFIEGIRTAETEEALRQLFLTYKF